MIRHNGITIDRRTQTIVHAGRGYLVPKHSRIQFQLLCTLILAGPITYKELVSRIYGDRDDGGPVTNSILSMITQGYRPLLEHMRLELRRDWHNSRTRYWIEPIELAESWNEMWTRPYVPPERCVAGNGAKRECESVG